jgi:signal transduction histidine kinase/CheY-like chemotaxis protein
MSVLDAICKIQNLIVEGKPKDEIYTTELQLLLELSGSEAGYIAEIKNNTEGKFLNYTAKVPAQPPVPEDVGFRTISKKTISTADFTIIPLFITKKQIGQVGLAIELGPDKLKYIEPLITQIAIKLYHFRVESEKVELLRIQSMSKAKSLLIANVSHELRTPLNALMGIEIIRDGSIELLVLINDILDISKLEAGEMQLYPNSTDVVGVVDSSYKIVGQMAYDKGLKFDFNIADDVPEHIIVDSNRLKQMMKNLLSNAIKFTSVGSVHTEVTIATPAEITHAGLPSTINPIQFTKNILATEKGATKTKTKPQTQIPGAVNPALDINRRELGEWNYIKFSVTDTGIGIAPENICRLFKSFSQLDDSSTKEYEGTGLGLAITYQLCTLMNGFIGVESTPGVGSTFYFIIPVQTHIYKIEKALDMALLNDRMFLVVDDNTKNLIRLTTLLEKWGVKFRECESPQRAVMSYLNNPNYKFDLGLLDIVMPIMSGNELAAKIASSVSPFPLIALSSATQQINSVSPAFAAHINKPYKDEELLQIILEVLSRQEDDSLSSSDDSSRSSPMGLPQQVPRSPRSPPATTKASKLKSIGKLTLTGFVPARKPVVASVPQTKAPPLASITHPSNDKMMRSMRGSIPMASGKHRVYKDYVPTIKNAGISILVVEDKPRNMETIIKMLNSAGYFNIDSATNGFEAVERVKANRGVAFNKKKSEYSVILMDIIMPKMDGVEATKKISELFPRKHRPKIIAVTARITDDAQTDYIQAGMDDVIFKPVSSISTLVNKLKSI